MTHFLFPPPPPLSVPSCAVFRIARVRFEVVFVFLPAPSVMLPCRELVAEEPRLHLRPTVLLLTWLGQQGQRPRVGLPRAAAGPAELEPQVAPWRNVGLKDGLHVPELGLVSGRLHLASGSIYRVCCYRGSDRVARVSVVSRSTSPVQ